MDVDKHYQRKEYLLFPNLEKKQITGPPKIMWGKHDEIREQLKACIALLKEPEMEEVLIKTAPQFKKLKNPLLRKTIARVTTLSQAASIGGVKVEELINTLRQSTGQEKLGNHSK